VADISRLLFSEAMGKLIQRVRSEFDFVLIDTPPALDFADSRMVSLRADGVVVVLRANRTDDKTAMATMQGFLLDRIPVLGTILNQWEAGTSSAYRYGRYRYERNG
jgi:receptor protein-tyrosine kinase